MGVSDTFASAANYEIHIEGDAPLSPCLSLASQRLLRLASVN